MRNDYGRIYAKICAVRSLTRPVVLALLVATAAVAMVRSPIEAQIDEARYRYVTTAQQLGVVGYRDPLGVVSRDGQRVAVTEGRRLFEMPVSGGVRTEVVALDAQIRHVTQYGTSPAWVVEDPASPVRWWIVAATGQKTPLLRMAEVRADATSSVAVNRLRQITIPDGGFFAGIADTASGMAVWRIATNGSFAQVTRVDRAIAWPAFMPSGHVACIMSTPRGARLSAPCGQAPMTFEPDVDVIGPVAFSPNGSTVFFAVVNQGGTVDLWSADVGTRQARRLTGFTRDTYAPSVTSDGSVLFKTQSYRTSVAELDLSTSRLRQLSTLQAETPSYHPDGFRVGVTYGTWRRVVDDARYPDIAQDIGVLPAGSRVTTPVAEPIEIIAKSDSEDQAMAWSPNGKWIAFHSHREQSDDIWLRPVDGSTPDRRVSFLGRGAEVGWPRWSPDGRWVLYDGSRTPGGRSIPFVIGIDQTSGAVTTEPREITVTAFDGDMTHGEWLPDSRTIIAIGKSAPGEHVILTVPAAGGRARVVHRFASEHDFPGLAVSPDGSRVAFIAPAADGFYQVFAIPVAGGQAKQLTFDRTHKTQPAWSPDGRRLALTIWSYQAQFWMLPR